jgi:hypothetical protein
MATALGGKTVRGAPHGLYWRFNRFLERYLPAGLYPRSLIIVIAPVVVLQAIMATVILDHHWEKVSRMLSRYIAGEMAFVIASYEASPKTPASVEQLQELVGQHLDLDLDIQTGASLPLPLPSRRFSMLDHQLSTFYRALRRQAVLDRYRRPVEFLDARVQVEPGTSCSASSPARNGPMPPIPICSCGGWEGPRSSCCLSRWCSCATRSARSCSWRTLRRASEWAAMSRSFARAVLPRCSRRRRPSSR